MRPAGNDGLRAPLLLGQRSGSFVTHGPHSSASRTIRLYP